MSLAADVLDWFTTAANWRGTSGVPHRLLEHVLLSTGTVVAAAVTAVPAGLWLGRRPNRRASAFVTVVVNAWRAVPSYGILVLFVLAFGLGGWPGFGARPAIAALFALAVPPILVNTYVGIRGVDPDVRDAALGLGMSPRQLAYRVELPLAAPLIVAGVRTAAVQVVATATLAAVTAWGGLGRFIVDGFARFDDAQLVAGALLVALLAVMTEAALGFVQRLTVPAALRSRERPAHPAAPAHHQEAT